MTNKCEHCKKPIEGFELCYYCGGEVCGDCWEKGEINCKFRLDTWTCHVCKKRRDDKYISVYTIDTSRAFKLPKGHVITNVRHCNDNDICKYQAKRHPMIYM